MRSLRLVCAAAVLMSPVVTLAAASAGAGYEVPLDGTSFSVTGHTSVPGATLKPGTYSIRVLDHLRDRVVIRIEDKSGKSLTTFLGLPDATIRTAGTGAIQWSRGPHKQAALRGFVFPGGNGVEFVYPKAQAVEIAKVNDSKVAAVDPASEGRPSDNKKLSAEDLQMLNLWSLSATRVGPADASQPAIKAEHYQPVQEARNVIPPTPEVRRSSNQDLQPVSSVAPVRRPAPSQYQAAVTPRRKALTELPRTASSLPAMLLSGIMALALAGALRMRRRLNGRNARHA